MGGGGMMVWSGGWALCHAFRILMFHGGVVWEGGLGYIVLMCRRELGKF